MDTSTIKAALATLLLCGSIASAEKYPAYMPLRKGSQVIMSGTSAGGRFIKLSLKLTTAPGVQDGRWKASGKEGAIYAKSDGKGRYNLTIHLRPTTYEGIRVPELWCFALPVEKVWGGLMAAGNKAAADSAMKDYQELAAKYLKQQKLEQNAARMQKWARISGSGSCKIEVR